MKSPLKVLGIETSCDETAASIVQDSADLDTRILSNVVLSQLEEHEPYGGVVPEIAARAHLHYLQGIVKQALLEANTTLTELDAIAVTGGPGLIGGVLVGVMTAKALSLGLQKPFIAVNHLEGHALTPRLSHDLQFPYLLLLASGGHCQFLEVLGVGQYKVLGSTIDDAAGEAFDKVAKLVDLDYPGGPAMERLAELGNPDKFSLPRPLKGREGCDLSFAGLKTAARVLIQKQSLMATHLSSFSDLIRESMDPRVKHEDDKFGKINYKVTSQLSKQDTFDMCASFQKAIAESLADRAKHAIKMASSKITHFVVSGGVAANQTIRRYLQEISNTHNLEFIAPPLKLCTDNAAMIAWVGMERFKLGLTDDLSFAPKPRWPL